MGLLNFIKDAGEKLFSPKPAQPQPSQAQAPAPGTAPNPAAAAAPAQDMAALNQTAATAIANYIRSQNLPADKLDIGFDGASGTVTVRGEVADQATREKILLCCGNVHAVEHVDDRMTVATPAPEARYYTVKSGDTLSKIAKEMYGDANRYHQIFEANRPMLSNPDKIYPGQMLRIPPQ